MLREEIGSGHFGTVFKGIVTGGIRDLPGRAIVAVKQCTAEISLLDIKDFLKEADLMKKFSDPHHPNVMWHAIGIEQWSES